MNKMIACATLDNNNKAGSDGPTFKTNSEGFSMNTPAKGKGYWSKVCHVDLTKGSVEFEEFPDSLYQKYVGGLGLGAKALYDHIPAGVDPLGPENVLGFTTGTLTDTGSMFSGRFLAVAKSPLSNSWGDSNCGGHFSRMLKKCGVDALFFHGAAPTPVYVYIDERDVFIKEAAELWDKDTIETETILKRAHNQKEGARRIPQVACIGKAGVKLSRIAGICTSQGRMAGRGGLGAVMGSKNLKAVVAAGNLNIQVADHERMKQLTRDFSKRVRRHNKSQKYLKDPLLAFSGKMLNLGVFVRQPALVWKLMLKKYGTCSMISMSAESGDSPIKNWAGSVKDFPSKKYYQISADKIRSYEVKKYGCYSCPLQCGGIISINENHCIIPEMHKPEYETICALGDLLLNDDIHSIFKINDAANRAGMDTISLGGVLAFAIDCYTAGLITKRDCDGLELNWGNSSAIMRLADKVMDRDGIGDVLADGVKLAAERIGAGSKQFAAHCGGVEAPMHDPKFDPGFALTYYCEPAPARHTVAGMLYLDVQNLESQFSRAKKPPMVTTSRGKYNSKGKAEAIATGIFYKMIVDGAGICLFGTQIGADLPLCEWLNAATGWDLSNDDYLICGERIEQLRHLFNVRDGVNPIRDFRPNPRIYGADPVKAGPMKNIQIDIDSLAHEFYDEMEWDYSTGKPSSERLMALGMEDYIR